MWPAPGVLGVEADSDSTEPSTHYGEDGECCDDHQAGHGGGVEAIHVFAPGLVHERVAGGRHVIGENGQGADATE